MPFWVLALIIIGVLAVVFLAGVGFAIWAAKRASQENN